MSATGMRKTENERFVELVHKMAFFRLRWEKKVRMLERKVVGVFVGAI